jgi:hypothetical protein
MASVVDPLGSISGIKESPHHLQVLGQTRTT